eukprot:7640070-Alexandrium_andersonii.AAC.1
MHKARSSPFGAGSDTDHPAMASALPADCQKVASQMMEFPANAAGPLGKGGPPPQRLIGHRLVSHGWSRV